MFGPFDEERRADPLRRAAAGQSRCAAAAPPTPSSRSARPTARSHAVEASAFPILTAARLAGRDRGLLASQRRQQRGRPGMKVKLWGTRGSLASPGRDGPVRREHLVRRGTLSDGTTLDLERGPASAASARLARRAGRLHILLTHLHLDHIQGLVLRAALPSRRPRSRSGARPARASLADRTAATFGAAISGRSRELPCDSPSASARRPMGDRPGADPRRLRHPPRPDARVPDRRRRASLAYLPDHEPALGGDLDAARRVDLRLRPRPRRRAPDPRRPVHRPEYPEHVGWGHSALSHSLAFARRTGAERTVLFHHDPCHADDFLDGLDAEAREAWVAGGGDPAAIELGAEHAEYELPAERSTPAATV